MINFCPLYKNKEVFDKFNKMIEAFGGKAMTEEEFKSGELRMQRSGLDLSSVEAAYTIYDLNNGHFLDEAPNGSKSVLYEQLLQLGNYDEQFAIREKSDIYTEEFRKKYGDWLQDENIKIKLDLNGEPLLSNFIEEKNPYNSTKNEQLRPIFNKETQDSLEQGQTVSSEILLSDLLQNNNVSDDLINIAKILSVHNIKVKYNSNLGNQVLGQHTIDENGIGTIELNPILIKQASNDYITKVFVHELIHAITSNAIFLPKTQYEKQFRKENAKMFELFNKIFPEYLYQRNDLYYGLTNEVEFAAEFMANTDFRFILFEKAKELDNNRFRKIFKSFINAISNVFINKDILKTNVDKLNNYKKTFNDYLLNIKPITDSKVIENESVWKAAYRFSGEQLVKDCEIEQFKRLNRDLSILKNAPFMHIVPRLQNNNEDYTKRLQMFSENASNYLTLRLKALLASNLPEYYKSKNKQILEQQISMFKQGYDSLYNSIIYLLNQSIPQLTQDCESISNKLNSGIVLDSDSYMYQMHDNFGTYSRLYNELGGLLESDVVKQILQDQISNDPQQKDETLKAILALKNQVENAKKLSDSCINCLKQMLMKNVRHTLIQIGNETNDPTMVDYLESLLVKYGDISAFTQYVGSADKTNDTAIRSLSYLINKSRSQIESATLDKANELLKLKKNLSLGESISDLYELDENGVTTGYIVRDLNFGQFENDYNKFLNGDTKSKDKGSIQQLGLNKYISKKYGILLESDNRIAPDTNDEARKEWLHLQNEWLDKHCERQYTKEYYELFNNLSNITRNARSDIQRQIDAIKSECLGDDGFYHYDKLNDGLYKTLQGLYIQKKMLASDYNINGDLKEVGSTEWQIAKELQELNKKISPSQRTIQLNTEAWSNQRNAVIEECGGHEEYKKYLNDEENSFDIKKLNRWDSYNSKKVFKRDADGNVILFKQIDDEIGEKIIYETDGDKGAAYDKIKTQIKELYSLYRDRNSGDIMWNMIPKQIKAKINKLEKEKTDIRNKARRNNLHIRQLLKLRQELYKKYTKSVSTQVYQQMLKYANSHLSIEERDLFFDETHVAEIDWLTGMETGSFRLKKQYSKLVAREEYEDQFMELIPGDGYMESNNNNEFTNKNFEALKKYNKRWVPKKSIKKYDNTAAYNKIVNSNSLTALYNSIIDTMKKSNQYYKKTDVDNYLLPQITGSMFKRMKNQSGKWRHALDYVGEKLGFGKNASLQNEEFGINSNDVLDRFDETGNLSNLAREDNVVQTGTRPDGRSLNMIPQFYTSRLDNPGYISADLIGIVCEYYNKAFGFDNKSKIQNQCESIIDVLHDRKVYRTSISAKVGLSKKEIQGYDSRAHAMAKKFLDMNLYNRKTVYHISRFNKLGLNFTFNWGVFASAFKKMVTAINLGVSPVVALVGGFSTMFAHIIQAITGQRYGIREATLSGTQVLYDLITTSPLTLTGTVIGGLLCNPILGIPAGMVLGSIFDRQILRRGIIQNRLTNNKSVAMMELFGISNQLQRKYTHSNRLEAINTINDNWCFGAMSLCDFIIKSQIMNSVLMSYRYYNGEFCTKEDLQTDYIHKPYSEYKEELKKWKSGVSAYSIHEMKEGELSIRQGYEQYQKSFLQIKDMLKNRIEKYCESYDGMQSETQKSAITSNILGAFVLMHRQYLPVMLQERFGHSVWDNSTQQITGGIFRSAINPNTIKSILSAMWGASIDMFTANQNYYDSFNSRYYKDAETPMDILKKRYNMYKLKQVSTEMIAIYVILTPLVHLLERYINDNDDDNKLLNLLLYVQYRSLWESQTPYLFSDLSNNVKTVTAGTSGTDKLQNLIESTSRTYFPFIFDNLLDTFLPDSKKKKFNKEVQRGSYKGWLKVQRDLFKLTPFHNVYEQYYDSKSKTRYFKNQIMKEND